MRKSNKKVSALSKVLFITAGLGKSNYSSAASRIKGQLLSKVPDSKILVLDSTNFDFLCPATKLLFEDSNIQDLPGYGFWAWKSEVVYRALNGDFGCFDAVVYIDSGCEFMLNRWNVHRLRRFIQIAKDRGAFLFDLKTPEYLFTKELVLREFEFDASLSTNQYQATWFILSGDFGIRLARTWFEATQKDISFSDNILSEKDNLLGVQHRNDQSLFSLSCKRYGLLPSRYTPVDGKSFKSRVRGLCHPIWTSRNRSGFSIAKFQ